MVLSFREGRLFQGYCVANNFSGLQAMVLLVLERQDVEGGLQRRCQEVCHRHPRFPTFLGQTVHERDQSMPLTDPVLTEILGKRHSPTFGKNRQKQAGA